MDLTSKNAQLTLDFESGLTDRHQSLRDVIATCVYKRGLSRTAIELNKAPGNLSVDLHQGPGLNGRAHLVRHVLLPLPFHGRLG
jgi:hypothetical protein